MSQTSALKTTPLNAVHRRMNAKMVDFGGWDMPVQYSGILEEHNAVRNAVGVFDVSHMGEIELAGKDALAAVRCFSFADVFKPALARFMPSPASTFMMTVHSSSPIK